MRKTILTLLNALLLSLIVFAALSAAGNLIGLPQAIASLNAQVSLLGWILLILQVALPLTLGAAALWLSRGKAAIRPLILLLALTLSAAWQIELLYLIPRGAYIAL